MEERQLTEKESLEVITAMIARTKERYIGDGNIMLMWGYLTVAVAVIIWVLLAITHSQVWNWLWFLIWIIGGIATPIMSKKELSKKGVKNYTDTLSSNIWTVVGFSSIAATFMCLGFLLLKGIDTWSMMLSFALVIVPFAEIAQGIVINEKPLVAGGSVGLAAGIFTTCCIAGHVTLNVWWFMPMFIVAFIFMMVIPGHILNHKARKEK